MSVKYYSNKKLLEQFSKVLHENMTEGKVSIKTLANKMAISTCQLNRRIKEATGQTTSDYVLNIRIREAKRFLRKFPEISIYETARLCGFADSAHFCHVFRRKENMSPTQYIDGLNGTNIPKKE